MAEIYYLEPASEVVKDSVVARFARTLVKSMVFAEV